MTLALLLGATACGDSGTAPPSTPPVVVVDSAFPEAVVGVAFTTTLSASGGDGTYSWFLSEGTLPEGLTLSSDGVLSGTPQAPGTSAFIVRVESADVRAAASFELSVVRPLSIQTARLPDGIVGRDYLATLVASGGGEPVRWTLVAGSLPEGLTFDPTGTISGTPSTVDSVAVTVAAASGSQTVSRRLDVHIVTPMAITTPVLEPGIEGVAYEQWVRVEGGTGAYVWFLGGRLPEGLELDGATGRISGTPEEVGIFPFTLLVNDGSQSVETEFALEIFGVLGLADHPLGIGVIGAPYSGRLQAEGGSGTYRWSLAEGSTLPAGLTLDPGGSIAGIPTVVGPRTFEVDVASGVQQIRALVELLVQDSVRLVTDALPDGVIGRAYRTALVAAEGTGEYAFDLLAGTLPQGMRFSGERGRVEGTPSEAGTFTVTIQVTSGSTVDVGPVSFQVSDVPCDPAGLDTDGDRLADCIETGTFEYLDETNTGTSPLNPDTDDDGISDGDEVLGSPGGLDLPGMGVHPLRKDILIEYDWMADSWYGSDPAGEPHDHRPTPAVVALVEAAFAAAPVTNPDGSTGITIIQDYGQGGVFTGGGLVEDSDGCLVGGIPEPEYRSHLARHRAPERAGYFHWTLFVHEYGAEAGAPCRAGSGSSGQAEFNGDLNIVASGAWYDSALRVANTIVHELGHNLSLGHGGKDPLNHKPNYPSVMNYRYQFTGVDVNCDVAPDGVLDFSRGARIVLDENAVDESTGVCGSTPIDWNRDGDTDDSGLQLDLQGFKAKHDLASPNGSFDVLEDHDDWAALTIASSIRRAPARIAGRLEARVVSCPGPPDHAGGGG